jgi:hypothetical protein
MQLFSNVIGNSIGLLLGGLVRLRGVGACLLVLSFAGLGLALDARALRLNGMGQLVRDQPVAFL